MQTMSSPSMSDAADTPVSGSCGSPSPSSPLSTAKQILDFSKGKDSSESDSANDVSPKTADNERSVNSSPATLVPTPRSTPPVNGILTPPNDVEGSNEPSKMGKPGGRLKFFKDGVLCLELTHHGEGERPKWVQIRSKTVFPTLVHTVKEATIPCHSTPSSFASPSSLTHNHRVESSTSHSLSDDACSMLSSPRARESNWKQAVPQRGVSTCLQFYMTSAPCVLKLRGKLKESSNSEDYKRKRWPYYNYRGTDIFLKLKNSVQCCCDEQSRVLTDSSISVNNNNNDSKQNNSNDDDKDNDNGNDNGNDENDDVSKRKLNETKRSSSRAPVTKRKVSLDKLVEHLEKVAVAEAQSKLLREAKSSKTNGDVSESGRKCSSVKNPAITPKKRLFNEVETKESNNIRPKKKSPSGAHETGRTILNVPGLNSDFYKRHTPTKSTKSLVGHTTPSSSLAGVDMVDLSKSRRAGVEVNSHKRNNRSPHFGAKTVSPGTNTSGGSTLKPGLAAELVDRFPSIGAGGRNNATRLSDEHSSPRHHSTPSDLQEQQYLQQQTVSKAISYTINSLLGSGSVANESGSTASNNPITKRLEHASSQKLPKVEVLSPHPTSNFHGHRERESKHNSPIRNPPRPDQDQKSFLRHLLDTSDPIPKSGDRSTKNLSRTAPVSHPSSNSNNNSSRNSSNSVLKTSKPSNNHNHHSHHDAMARMSGTAALKSGTGKGSVSSSHRPAHPPKDPMADVQQSIATNIALQSLMSQLPFGVATNPYELLARGASANQHSTDALTAAAAAAAALQYGSLIPGNPFAPGNNNAMAAAMAASYFGMMQPLPNFPISATPPSSSSGSQSSPPPTSSKSGSSSNSIRKRQHELLNSNQRGSSSWQGMVNGGGPHSHGTSSFRKASTATSTSTNSHQRQHSPSPVRSSSAISSIESPSCGALNLSAKKKNKVEEHVDLDAPLDLCKKSSR